MTRAHRSRPRSRGAAFAPVFVGAALAPADGAFDGLVVAALNLDEDVLLLGGAVALLLVGFLICIGTFLMGRAPRRSRSLQRGVQEAVTAEKARKRPPEGAMHIS